MASDVKAASDPAAALLGVLDDVAALISRFVWFPQLEQLWVVTVWLAHTHLIEAAYATPYLHVESPLPQCGKSTLFEVLHELARRALSASNATPAALFRIIDADSVTLFLDEIDAQLGENPEKSAAIRSVLNSGYRRGSGATVLRCEGAAHQVRTFNTFGPKALAGVSKPGTLHPTTLDRCIPIRLERQTAAEATESFRAHEVAEEIAELRDRIESLVPALVDSLKRMKPDLPDALTGRAAEAWEPLAAIAALAGDPWATRVRQAAVALGTAGAPDEESAALLLLSDLRELVEGLPCVDGWFSEEICAVLREREERPWGSWGSRRSNPGLNPRDLARQLRPFGIRPRSIRMGHHTGKGYKREQFEEAWARYLPPRDSVRDGH
jgi:hypothetical protein